MRSRQRIINPPDPTPVDRAVEKSTDEMSITTKKYARKQFIIDAVEVTPENLQAIAEWCKGEVVVEKQGRKLVQYVKVKVSRPLNERQGKAYVGDWVLYAGTGYKVYTAKAFATCFEEFAQKLDDLDNEGTLFEKVEVEDDCDCKYCFTARQRRTTA